MTDDLVSALARLVAAAAHPAVDPATITSDTVLLRGGLELDSLSLLELVVGLEGLGIRVASDEVTPARFGTFERLLAYARARGA